MTAPTTYPSPVGLSLVLLLLKEAIVSETASSHPIKQSSSTAKQDLPSESPESPESPDLRQEAQTAPTEPRDSAAAEAVSDDSVSVGVARPAEAGIDDEGAPPQEDDIAPGASTGPVDASAKPGIEEEGEAVPDTADEVPRMEGVVGSGQGGQDPAIEENASTAGGSEQAEADTLAPASGAVELGEQGGLGAGAKEELGGGRGVGSVNGDGGMRSGADIDAGAEVDAEKVAVDVEVDGASVADEVTRGDGVEKPAAAAREPETSSGKEIGGGEVVAGGVAEDFFAGDDSSGEDELYPGAAAAAAGGAAGAIATQVVGSDQEGEPPVREQPLSPRIIASSVQSGFRSPVATQRKETAGAVGEEGLSAAAKAAVAAALANAASAPSRRGDDGSKSRKKKKSHKERRRRRSGSKSADEEDSGAGSRGSGSVGRSEVDGNRRTKRSSSKRDHRKSAVG